MEVYTREQAYKAYFRLKELCAELEKGFSPIFWHDTGNSTDIPYAEKFFKEHEEEIYEIYKSLQLYIYVEKDVDICQLSCITNQNFIDAIEALEPPFGDRIKWGIYDIIFEILYYFVMKHYNVLYTQVEEIASKLIDEARDYMRNEG